MTRQIRCLLLGANPGHLDWIKPEVELEVVRTALGKGEIFQIEDKPSFKLAELAELLDDNKPDIVHICGHASESGFETEEGMITTFTPYFKGICWRPRCVMISACDTKRLAEQLKEYVDCTIGISGDVDGNITFFVSAFYQAISNGKNLQQAFYYGERSHSSYIGLSSRTDLHLFHLPNVDPAAIVLTERGGASSTSSEILRWKQLHKDWQNIQLQVVLLWKLMQLPDLENTLIDFECLWPACRRGLRRLTSTPLPELQNFYDVIREYEKRLDSFGLSCEGEGDLRIHYNDLQKVLSNTVQSLTEMLTIIDGKLQRLLTA